jgi:hypothetical protein
MEETTSSTMNLISDISGIALNVKQFSNGNDVENSSVTSKARIQTREKQFKSGCYFEEDNFTYDEKGMVLFKEKVDLRINGSIVAEPVTVGHSENGTLAQIWPEKNSVLEDTSSCNIPEKRMKACDCLPQMLSCKFTQTEDALPCAGDDNNFLVSGSNSDVKDYLQQANKVKTDNRNTPRKRQLKLKLKNMETVGPARKRARVLKHTSGLSKYSDIIVEVPGSNASYVCSDLLKMNDSFCLETGESSCVRPGQPLTNISGDNVTSCFVSVMSSSIYGKSSSTSFNIAGYSEPQSTDLSSQSKANPPTTSVLPGKHPDASLDELVGKKIHVTQSSETLLNERLESKLTLSTEMVDCVLHIEGESSAMKHFLVPQTEQDNRDIDEGLFPRDMKDNFVIVDDEVDVLKEIDDVLNYLKKDYAMKPLSVSQTEQEDKDSDKEQLQGDVKENFLILETEVDILRAIDDLLDDFH